MIYSELIATALHELNMSKKAFAEEIGISVTTLYRILNNKIFLPSKKILKKLSNKGIDISLLDYNDIYYNYVQEHYESQYEWVNDIEKNRIQLLHKECKRMFWIELDDIVDNNKMCPYCYPHEDDACYVDEQDVDDFSFDDDEEVFYYGMDIEGDTLNSVSDCLGEILIIPNEIMRIEDGALRELRKQSIKTIIIPDSVEHIGESAFANLSISRITLPSKLKIISDELFDGCTSLSDITLQEGIQEIGEGAFQCCAIKNIKLPDSITKIEAYAFSSCEKLEEIVIPNNVNEVCEATFDACYSLKSVWLPEGLEKIGDGAFAFCEALREVYIPSTVKTIEKFAFIGCKNLRLVVLPKKCIIGEHSFSDTHPDLIMRYFD